MIDSHCHIFHDDFSLDLEDVIKRAKENNINKMILVGFSKSTNIGAYNLSLKYPDYLYPTFGLHPSEVDLNYEIKLKELEEDINSHKIYAIGECGLDYHYDIEYKSEQKEAFKRQIELSIKYNLPLIIHSRDALADTYEILKLYPKAYGVMHCYSGSAEMAKLFLDLGFYISIGGPVTFKNARVPKEVVKEIPISKLLIETDSPYLAPMPNRGKRNEPSYLKYILEEVSNLKELDIDLVDEITSKNTSDLFKLER